MSGPEEMGQVGVSGNTPANTASGAMLSVPGFVLSWEILHIGSLVLTVTLS